MIDPVLINECNVLGLLPNSNIICRKMSVTKFHSLKITQFILDLTIKETSVWSYEEIKEITQRQDYKCFQILEWE